MGAKALQRGIVLALILAAVGGALAAHFVSTHQHRSSRSDRVAAARAGIADDLRRRAFYLEDVADMVGVHDDADETEFSRYARVRASEEPSVVAVQWLRRTAPGGKLVPPPDIGPSPVLITPANPEDSALADAANEAPAAAAIRAASLRKEVAVSAPVQLGNGHQGFYIAVPVEANDFSGDVSRAESRSAIVGLIDAQIFVSEGFPGGAPSGLVLSDGDTVLADVGSSLDDPVEANVSVPGQDWTVTVPGGSITLLERALPWLILGFGLGLALTVVLFLRSAAERRDAAMQLADARSAELEQRSREDSLTGVFNRRHLSEVLAGELARSERGADPPAVLMLDIDHFKGVNDQYGHLVGDEVLQAVAQRIASALRGSDVLARWGGDEFVVLALAPGIDRAGVADLAERARRAVGDLPIEVRGVAMALTLSVGAALAADGLETPDALVHAADKALYDAKGAGRNCTRVWEPSGFPDPAKTPA